MAHRSHNHRRVANALMMCAPAGLSSLAQPPVVRPGQRVSDSGIYQSDSGRRATMVEGEPAPPTPFRGEKWRQVVDTNPTRYRGAFFQKR
jgi:hypothetical protein